MGEQTNTVQYGVRTLVRKNTTWRIYAHEQY